MSMHSFEQNELGKLFEKLISIKKSLCLFESIVSEILAIEKLIFEKNGLHVCLESKRSKIPVFK